MALEDLLSRRQIETLRAATECILPSQDGPGAAEADVMGYFRWRFTQSVTHNQTIRLREGLDLLESVAQNLHGKSFAACTTDEQDATLGNLGKIPHLITQRFLAGLFQMTLAGFLCDPRYGGNRDYVGWRAIGFERRTASPEIALTEES